MRKVTAILALGVLVLSAYTLINEWKVVNKKDVKIEWQLVNEGTKGVFSDVETTITFDKMDLAKSSIKAIVNVKSLSTNSKGRDAHLMNEDFFDADKYPTITFESKEIKTTDKGFTASGNLTMKDQTHPVEVPFEFIEEIDGKASFKGLMVVSPNQFGVTKGKKNEAEKVNVSIFVPLMK
jgi:polyisoprenoid-binding protein YceI